MSSKLARLVQKLCATPTQHENLVLATKELIKKLESTQGSHLSVHAFGSTARRTYLKRSKDIDIFLEYQSLDENSFLETVNAVFSKYDLKSRGFLYITTHYTYNNKTYKVDIVPYDKNFEVINRTELHHYYLSRTLTEDDRRQIILLKYFLKKTGLYGAESETNGFSGIACEVLIHRYKTIDAIPSLSKLKTLTDPTRYKRNLLASVSYENLLRFDYLKLKRWSHKGYHLNLDLRELIVPDSNSLLRLKTTLNKKPELIKAMILNNRLIYLVNPYYYYATSLHPLTKNVLFKGDKMYCLKESVLARTPVLSETKEAKIYKSFKYFL